MTLLDPRAPEILVVVLARGGSKRLPDKNIRALEGRTLLERLDVVLSKSPMGRESVLLSTDSLAIAMEGKRLGWLVPFLRPAALATDHASSVDAVLHAVDWWKEQKGLDPAIVLLMQPTSPFRRPSDITAALTRLAASSELNAVIGAADLHRSASSLFRADSTGMLLALEDTTGSTIYTPNGSLYAIRTRALREEMTFVPSRTSFIVMDAIRSIDVDGPCDWLVAEAVATRLEMDADEG